MQSKKYASNTMRKIPIKETETDMNKIVLRASRRGVKNGFYHSNPNCGFALLIKKPRHSKLGAVLAAGFKKHC